MHSSRKRLRAPTRITCWLPLHCRVGRQVHRCGFAATHLQQFDRLVFVGALSRPLDHLACAMSPLTKTIAAVSSEDTLGQQPPSTANCSVSSRPSAWVARSSAGQQTLRSPSYAAQPAVGGSSQNGSAGSPSMASSSPGNPASSTSRGNLSAGGPAVSTSLAARSIPLALSVLP